MQVLRLHATEYIGSLGAGVGICDGEPGTRAGSYLFCLRLVGGGTNFSVWLKGIHNKKRMMSVGGSNPTHVGSTVGSLFVGSRDGSGVGWCVGTGAG